MNIPLSVAGAGAHSVRDVPEHFLLALFESPELYPVKIEFQKRTVIFVRMSPDTYRNSVFLDTRTQRLGKDVYEIRLDDILLRAANTHPAGKRIHYIFHPTFCCSTLLARYFELMPGCFVLKEPSLLTQLALAPKEPGRDWDQLLSMALRLLTRSYQAEGFVVIKTHEPCNAIAARLLDENDGATATFMMNPIRQFILASLKSEFRRNWIRSRMPAAAAAAGCKPLLHISEEGLTDAQASAYLWMVNRFLCEQLCAGKHGPRVHRLEGNELVDSPETALRSVMLGCGETTEDDRLKMLIEHPSMQRYSKDLSRPYDAAQRSDEMAELENRFGAEADSALEWAAGFGMDLEIADTRHTASRM